MAKQELFTVSELWLDSMENTVTLVGRNNYECSSK